MSVAPHDPAGGSTTGVAAPHGTTPVPTSTTATPHTAGSGSTTPPVTPPTADQNSAKGILDAFLGNYGLAGLGNWAWGRFLDGASVDQIMLELRSQDAYKQRFPAMEELGKRGQAITEQDYVNYERTVQQLYQAHGIPQGFMDSPSDIASFMLNNVSTHELDLRLQRAQQYAYNAPPEVKAEMSRMYGTSAQGNLTAYWLDPKLADPLLEKQFTSAQIAAEADLTKFGQISQAQAESLYGLGVTDVAARSGFSSLAQLGEVTSTQMAGEAALSQDQLLAAQFAGDANATAAIKARQAGRVGAFQGGGDYAQTQGGFAGIGQAQGA